MNLLIYIFFILFIHHAYSIDCFLPERCHLQTIYSTGFSESNDKGEDKELTVMCDINEENFEFRFKEPIEWNCTKNITSECLRVFVHYCPEYKTIDKEASSFILRWTNSKELNILDNRFNFSNVIRYNRYFDDQKLIKLWGLKGFGIDIFDETNVQLFTDLDPHKKLYLSFSNCDFDFYHKKSKINSCEDINKSNLTRIFSIFQITAYNLVFKNIEYKEKICPVLFVNSNIDSFVIHDLIVSFYRHNILTFSNETYPGLNSTIESINLYNVHNINLDLNLLNPSVYNNTKYIMIVSGSLNLINGEIFRHLNSLIKLYIDKTIFRKINHKQGIDWIKQWNYDVNVNFKNITNISIKFKTIALYSNYNMQRKRNSKIFPDEDFCAYRDFPFKQFVIIIEEISFGFNSFTYEFTCTYLWLIQYYEYYYEYHKNHKHIYYNSHYPDTVSEVIEKTEALKSIPNCEFEKRLRNCNKSNYQIKDIWDQSDFFIINKKIQIAFKISLYPISLFGLVTNFIVVLVILKKDNTDLFKEFKQYNYLYLNSVFVMMISVIELLSWMTECFYPFEVFCPEIRKLVAIQFFKIIFAECFVTMCKFMCNFTYIAFSLNRISLIGKDHGKLVTFMSEIGIKKYIGVTIFISSIFSWTKGFKHEVNYFYPDPNFPISNELNLNQLAIYPSRFKNFFMIFNSISDIVNYLVFVVICIIIDICMVVQLRRTLEEKMKKFESLNQKQKESKKAENEEAVNKAIKMVVLNSAIGILFKLPVCFLPLLNASAQFYYKDMYYKYINPHFGEFYSMLVNSGFYDLIQDMSHLLFALSLSIQMFIYMRFDKKFRTGYERLMKKTSTNEKAKSSK